MQRKVLKFSLRTLLVLVALTGVGLSLHSHFSNIHGKVISHHYQFYLNGKQAMELHRPKDDPKWLAVFNSGMKPNDWLGEMNIDRETVKEAIPLWEKSINHLRLRDYYRKLEKDWTTVFSQPEEFILNVLPEADEDLSQWWNVSLKPFILENELNRPFLAYGKEPFRFNVEIVNNEPSEVFKPFFELREIIGGQTTGITTERLTSRGSDIGR